MFVSVTYCYFNHYYNICHYDYKLKYNYIHIGFQIDVHVTVSI